MPAIRTHTPEGRARLVARQLQWQAPGADRPLWPSPIDFTLDSERTALVGRNGAGKSVLCGLLAGTLKPLSGSVLRHAPVRFVPQLDALRAGSLASLAGLAPVAGALARILAGTPAEGDLERAEGHWDLPQRWALALDDAGLPAWAMDMPADALSGGERQRVALAAAFLDEGSCLLLDEPSNHLDAAARAWLARRLDAWRGGLLLASHDRALLERVERIAELSPDLRTFGGGHAGWRAQRTQEAEAARQDADHARAEQRRIARDLQARHDAQQRRMAHGRRFGKEANLSGLLLGSMKDNAQRNDARALAQRETALAAATAQAGEARARLPQQTDVALALPSSIVPEGKRVLLADGVRLAHLPTLGALDVAVVGPRRIALTGANGSGKSTLLRTLAGSLPPAAGTLDIGMPCALLDQQPFASPQNAASLLALLQSAPVALPEAELRGRLALLGLSARHCLQPLHGLSGGEALKARLALALWGKDAAGLLLLDEPTNHLDLASVEAFEQALAGFPGAMIVASHDPAFLDAIGCDARWRVDGNRWRIS
ncbi:ABC-F family ATP-binding cassette domain-containing protein [Thermomonas brevis]|uniref:ABC-F family ATP-binding cassette domain-containing protein n=1 Tax=Thermomonas brevis TaxID=215691 RepID=A0A7G9QRM3_9GAMM|nr:ATP-binding cassette domain-containing protein [Thermomonas brevis]QNN45998.1 ABC-F family ATP-binding cassette domain-containing protein [Thermomonas brevis]